MKHEKKIRKKSRGLFLHYLTNGIYLECLQTFQKSDPIGPISQDLENDARGSFWCFGHN